MNTKTISKFKITADEAYPVWHFDETSTFAEEVQLDVKLVKKYLRAQKAFDKAWDELSKALESQHFYARS